MRAIDYCKQYGISQARLESILSISITSDYILSKEQEEIYPSLFNSKRRNDKKNQAMKKSKVIKKIAGKPNPWNKDNLKKKVWIFKK